jgi:hypothetical protein
MDWPYNLYTNFRWFVDGSENYVNTIRLNENPGFSFDLTPCVGGAADVATRAISILNNTFYDPTPSIPGPSIPKNENSDLIKFDYRINTAFQDPNTQIVTYGLDIFNVYCTWGNPTSFNLIGDSSTILPGYFQYERYIQPGWTVSATAPGIITLSASPSAIGTNPWIPSCVITADVVNGSKVLTSITGFEADFPQGGWLYDPSTLSIIGQFGPGLGKIEEDSGFVIYIEMDTAATFDADGYMLEVYPKRSGAVQFIDPALSNLSNLFVYASAKSPGTSTLGYLRGYYDAFGFFNSITWWPTHYYDVNPGRINHTYPLGNYYDWIGNPNVFYGGGLENSTLQFSQPYRHAQTYIYEGGANRQEWADGGGWYPSITWGSYGNFPDGGIAFTDYPVIRENLYKPISKVTVYDINGTQIVDPLGGSLYLILNTWFDGSAIIYTDSTNASFDFVSLGILNGDYLTVYLEDIDGDGESQTFECVTIDGSRGLIGKSLTTFSADYSQDLTLLYDYESYRLTNIAPIGLSVGLPFTLYPGMVIGNFANPLQYLPPFSTRITEVNEGQTEIMLSTPNTLTSGSSVDFYAYAPLDLPFKLQPTNEKVWSRTRQWDSMRCLYDRAFNAAFTWEDSTITIRERKIPVGASILFSSDASDIAGKTGFLWSLYKNDGTKLVSITNSDFLWTFLETGLYDVELEITDTNGNKQKRFNKNFVEIFIPEQS